jgi:trehalose 6-phosphate synthase
MLVTHRGPYRFSERSDGTFESTRGAGGLVSALLPLVDRDDNGDHTRWVAAAIDDDDRAAVAAGVASVPGLDLHLLDLDPEQHRMHYDIVSNAVLWFLYHGLFDLPRRPRFDRYLREAWEGYVAVNAAFADAVVSTAGDGEQVLVHDYHLALVPGMVRAQRSDLLLTHFTHTPFCGPNSIRVLPTDMADALCGSMATVPAGFHTTRWAAAYVASAHEILETDVVEPYAAPLGPDPESLIALAESASVAECAAELDELVGDRKLLLRADRIDLSKNIVRGFHVFDHLLATQPEWRGRAVFVAMLNRSRENLAEYLAYEQEVDQTAERINDRWGTRDW